MDLKRFDVKRLDVKRSRKRYIVFVVVFTLLMLGIGYGWGKLSEGAFGAEPPGRPSAPALASVVQADEAQPQARCCTRLAKRMARKFRNGHFKRASGIPVRKVFKRPAVAKEVIVNKITRKIRQQCNSASARTSVPTCRKAARSCDRCIAYDYYREMVKNVNCSGRGEMGAGGRYLCAQKYPGEGPRLTKRQVQVGGMVALCGGGVALGLRAGGGIAAIWGGAACGWSLWMAID